MHGLQILATARDLSVTAVMKPHKEVLQDMIPPKKHLLRHQPANAQIGIMVSHGFAVHPVKLGYAFTFWVEPLLSHSEAVISSLFMHSLFILKIYKVSHKWIYEKSFYRDI